MTTMQVCESRLRQRHAWATLLALALACGVGQAQPAPDRDWDACGPTLCSRAHVLPVTRELPRALAGQDDVDILDYDLAIWLDTLTFDIAATCGITFQPASGVPSASELVLDFESAALVITEVRRDGVVQDPAAITHAADVLTIPLVPPLATGSTRIEISYEGTPGDGLSFYPRGTSPIPVVQTFSQPFDARTWWPCKDRPDDKATLTMRVEAPVEMLPVSNGTLQSTIPGRAGHSITTWREQHPISTYLVSIAATNYVTWQDLYTSVDGATTMPIQYWSFGSLEANARIDWSVTPAMMEFFARAFVEYPFLDEKYGMAMFHFAGAMEHQTATSYGWALIDGTRSNDGVVAHELAHQWWGDSVGPRTYDSVWLNEGFATYSEALWIESQQGLAGYLAAMRSRDTYRARADDFAGTVHAPVGYFNSTVYYKGSWVLHMLRWLLGQPATSPDPEPVLEVLRAHALAHTDGSSETDDFVATASAVGGQDLAWFFDQWVHREGRPSYEVGWESAPRGDGSYDVHVRVRQLQPLTYRMPVLVRIDTASGSVEQIVWNELATTSYDFVVPDAPTAVGWDPDDWILKRVVSVDLDTDDDGRLDDVDCAPADPLAWSEPVGDTTLLLRRAGAEVILSFQHPDPLGQSAYVTDLARGGLTDLWTMRSRAGQVCLVAGHAADYVDAAVVAPGGEWFVAHPWNGCGPTEPDGTATSPCR